MGTFAPGGVNTMPMGTLRTGEERRYFFEGGVFLQGGPQPVISTVIAPVIGVVIIPVTLRVI